MITRSGYRVLRPFKAAWSLEPDLTVRMKPTGKVIKLVRRGPCSTVSVPPDHQVIDPPRERVDSTDVVPQRERCCRQTGSNPHW